MTSIWAAPGRVNLIGEHVDYNDGLVLPFALPKTTTARVSRTDAGRVSVASGDDRDEVSFAVDAEPGDVSGWAAYVAGVVWALRQESLSGEDGDDRRDRWDGVGLDIRLTSDVPVGAGLSSSAALECSVAAALNDELDLGLDRSGLAAVARRAENDFVGVPTGSMDQLASMLCEEGAALYLDCRSLQTRSVPLDLARDGLVLLVIDTHAEHELAGSEYGDRRDSCEQAAQALGVDSLRDATAEQADGLDDPVLRRRARHVVTEIERVRQVVAVLESGSASGIGGFLTASHDSLRDDYEVSCEELDVAVDAALAAGALGARMTGGGFGGCAIALCREDDVDRVSDAVQGAYAERGWADPTIWPTLPAAGASPVHEEPSAS